MQSDNRGHIRNLERFKQPCDFHKFRHGNITPTDIDILVELHDKKWFYGEIKEAGVDVPDGQRLVLGRQAIDFRKAGKDVIAFICYHNTTDASIEIPVSEAAVSEICIGEFSVSPYGNRVPEWNLIDEPMTALMLFDMFIVSGMSSYEILYKF